MADLQKLLEQNAGYAYPLLFVGVLLESAGVPLPGETAVLTAGFLASEGNLDVVIVILVTAAAAMLGDNLGYEMGRRWARPRLKEGRRFFFLTPTILQRVESYFDRYGVWTIFFGRFVAALRVAAALAAGAAGMPWPRFFVANAAGALLWATTIALLGYFFGHSISLLHEWLGRGSIIIISCVALIVGLPYLLRRLRKMSVFSGDRLVRAEVVQGILAAALGVACVLVMLYLARHDRPRHFDEAVKRWVEEHPSATLDGLAVASSWLGTFPVALGVALGMLVLLRRRGLPWGESAAVGVALAASEGLGWLLIGLLHHEAVEPMRATVWPFGFAGLVPLRGMAVFGMSAYLLAHHEPRFARVAHTAAAVAIFLTGFSVLWDQSQTLTELLVEYAAGSVILFSCIRRLEGFRRGWGPNASPATGADAPLTPGPTSRP